MRKSTIKTILILSWTVSTLSCLANDTTRCDSIEKARALRELAMKGLNSDKIINSQDSTIVILETTAQKTQAESEAKLKDMADKLDTQKGINAEVWKTAYSFRDERDSERKKVRGVKWQRNGLGLGLVAVIILSLTQ